MSHKLLIRLKNTANSSYLMEWMETGDDIVSTQSHVYSADNQHELINIAKTVEKIIVLVPGEDVLLTQVQLPKMSRARLAKAIPYALEDQITEDPAHLHFAISKANANGLITVAVVNKKRMIAWHTWLSSILKHDYFHVKAYLPDMLALPWKSDTVSVFIDQQIALVRTGMKAGFVIEREALFQMLFLTIHNEREKKLQSINIYTTQEMTVFTQEEIAQLNIPAYLFLALPNTLSLMGTSLNEHYPINLLQGEFLPVSKKITLKQLLTYAFGIVCVWFLIITLSNLVKYVILEREKMAIENEMNIMYRLLFPSAVLPNDLKASLQKELNKLQMSRSDSAFLRLLKTVGHDIVSLQGGLTVQSVTFQNYQIMVDLEANDLTVLDKLRQSLAVQGLKATTGNAERRANGLIATRLTVEETLQ